MAMTAMILFYFWGVYLAERETLKAFKGRWNDRDTYEQAAAIARALSFGSWLTFVIASIWNAFNRTPRA